MNFFVTDRDGAMETKPSRKRMRQILDELDGEDPEHPDVALRHESGWCLSAFESGLLVWENVEGERGSERHMHSVPRDRVLELWVKLSKGKIEEIEREDWQPGYG
jgi:hypothetical protein